ncbi:hypothetical protein BH09GEM1_BH09GEM1_08650 [soil metagenome]
MMRDTDNLGPEASRQTTEGVWPYLGVGCITAISGMMGSAMIAVLLAKMVGYARGCPADAETGAPCDWLTFAVRGGLLGLILIPTFVIRRMRKVRSAARNSSKRIV